MTALRAAKDEDREALVGLINDAYRGSEFFLVGDRIERAELEEMRGRGQFWVVDGDGRLNGAIYVRIDGECGYFGTLSVRPEVRGRGLGRALIAFAEGQVAAAGCGSLSLKVAHLRTDLIPWYGRLGYRATGSEPFPASIATTEPVHFIIMSKPLGGADKETA